MVRQKKLLKNNLTVDKENFNSLNTSKSESMRPKSQQIKFQLPKSIKKQFDTGTCHEHSAWNVMVRRMGLSPRPWWSILYVA